MQFYIAYVFFTVSLLWNELFSQKNCNIRSSSCIVIQSANDVIYNFDHTRSYDGNNFEWYYGFEPYPIQLILHTPLSHDTVQMTLKGYGEYDVTYVPVVGSVKETHSASAIQTKKAPSNTNSATFVAETKILELLEGPINMGLQGESLMISKENKTVVFNQVSPPVPTPLDILIQPFKTFSISDASLEFLTDSYSVNGLKSSVYTGSQFPIYLIVLKYSSSSIEFLYEGLGLSIFNYSPLPENPGYFKFNSETILKAAASDSASIHINDDEVVKSVLRTLTQISVSGSHLLLSSQQGGIIHKLSFVPKTNENVVTPVTMDMNVEVTVYKPGLAKIRSTIPNKYQYTVIYKEQNNKILSVNIDNNENGLTTVQSGSSQQMKLHNDIQSASYIIVDQSSNKLSLNSSPDVQISEYTINWLTVISGVDQQYNLIEGSYLNHNEKDNFFTSHMVDVHTKLTVYETHPGFLKANFLVNSLHLPYTYVFQVKDGWVLKIVKEFDKVYGGLPNENIAVEKLSKILDNVQQISFDGDNILQFITDYSSTRMAFTKAVQKNQVVTQGQNDLTVVIDEYIENNKLKVHMIKGPYHPHYELILYPGTTVVKTAIVTQNYNMNNLEHSSTDHAKQIHSILMNAKLVKTSDGNKNGITVTAKSGDILYLNAKSIKLIPTQSTTNLHPNVGSKIEYNLLPKTYQVNYALQSFYGSHPIVHIPILVTKVKLGVLEVKLDLYQTAVYNINYQEHDGWVTSSYYSLGSVKIVPDYYRELHQKLHHIISKVQQLGFEKDGTLQFIGKNTQDRVAFKSTGSSKVSSVVINGFVDYSIYTSGNHLTGSNNMDIEKYCKIDIFEVGLIKFNCVYLDPYKGSKTSEYYLYFTPPSNAVTHIRSFPAPGLENSVLSQAVKQVRRLEIYPLQIKLIGSSYTAVLQSYSYTVNFVTQKKLYNIPFQLSFLPAYHTNKRNLDEYVVDAVVKPGFYFSSTQPLVNNGFPHERIQIQISKVGSGKVQLTVETEHSIYSFVTTLNNFGEVISITQIGSNKAHQSIQTHHVIYDFINNLYSIYKTPHGLKFVSKNKQELIFMEHTVGKYNILPQTYFKNGQFESLYQSVSEYPMSLTVSQNNKGQAKITLYGKQIHSFVFKFQHHDGWVTQRTLVGSLPIVDHNGYAIHYSENDLTPEKKIVDILNNVQQLAFEADSTLQLLTDYGKTRISFSQTANSLSAAYDVPTHKLGHKTLKPETYRANGNLETLPNNPVTFSIDVEQPYNGAIIVILNGVNKHKYIYEYQHHDGWVEWQVELYKDIHTGSYHDPNSVHVEQKLTNILGSVQQIAFENDGKIQFIKDNGSTRVTFQ